MLLQFFTALRDAKVPVTLREYLTLLDALDRDLAGQARRGVLLPGAHGPGEGRAQPRPVRPGVRHGLQGARDPRRGGRARRDPRGMAAQARREIPHRRREGGAEGAGLGQAVRDPEAAPRRAEGAPPGRLEMDRHRRHLALRRLRLQSRGHPHRPGRQPQLPRGEGLGQARVQGSRRHGRARHPQHAGRAAAPAPLRPHGRGRGTRPRRHDPRDAPPRATSTCSCGRSGATP